MDEATFRAALLGEGFADAVTVTREPNGFLDVHIHPYAAKALIIAGEIVLRVADVETCYRVGEIFHLPANTPHAETYGPSGVHYLVGRK